MAKQKKQSSSKNKSTKDVAKAIEAFRKEVDEDGSLRKLKNIRNHVLPSDVKVVKKKGI